MGVLATALNKAPPSTNRAIEERLRGLLRAPDHDLAGYLAGYGEDPVIAILKACSEISPDLISDVVAELGIELHPTGGTGK
jgi:hypothetical protein